MSDGITSNQLTNPLLENCFSVVKELSDAEFKALPSDPYIIVPSTEVLNYSGFPSAIPVSISATIIVNNAAGAYIADSDAYLVIAMGSDWSSDLTQKSLPTPLTNAGLNVITLAPKGLVSVVTIPLAYSTVAEEVRLNDSVIDNAIVLAASNGSAGNFTGGNAANKAWVIFTYQLFQIP